MTIFLPPVLIHSLNNITAADGKRTGVKSTGSEGSTLLNCSLLSVDFKSFKATWNEEVQKNREKWKAQATKDLEEKAKKEAAEKAAQEEVEGGQSKKEESPQVEPSQAELDQNKPAEEEKGKEEETGSKETGEEGKSPSRPDPSSLEAEEPSSTRSSDSNQPVQNGEVPETADLPECDDSEKKTPDAGSGEKRTKRPSRPASLAALASAARPV
ncbi:calcium/calmodulin-dependent 3',5'-cyclic nucleotide phosphodiesterase 1C-like [Arapaima gigas]